MKKAVPQDVRSRYLEALLELRQGDPAKAKEAILHVLKVAPDHAPSQLLAGAIELQLRAFGTAEDHLRKVLARYPQSIVARRLLAAAYLGAGQPAKAERCWRRRSSSPRTTRSCCGWSARRRSRAATSQGRRSTTSRQPRATRTTRRCARGSGRCGFATGDVDQAFKDLEAASAIDPDQYQADLALVLAHARRREYDQALAAAAKLEKKQPTNPLTFNVKGAVYLAKGDRKNARASFEKALELKPDYLPAAANLARLDLADKQPGGRAEAVRGDRRQGPQERAGAARAGGGPGGDESPAEGGDRDGGPRGRRESQVGPRPARGDRRPSHNARTRRRRWRPPSRRTPPCPKAARSSRRSAARRSPRARPGRRSRRSTSSRPRCRSRRCRSCSRRGRTSPRRTTTAPPRRCARRSPSSRTAWTCTATPSPSCSRPASPRTRSPTRGRCRRRGPRRRSATCSKGRCWWRRRSTPRRRAPTPRR